MIITLVAHVIAAMLIALGVRAYFRAWEGGALVLLGFAVLLLGITFGVGWEY